MQVTAANPSATRGEVIRLLRVAWHAMSEEEKAPYDMQASTLREDYVLLKEVDGGDVDVVNGDDGDGDLDGDGSDGGHPRELQSFSPLSPSAPPAHDLHVGTHAVMAETVSEQLLRRAGGWAKRFALIGYVHSSMNKLSLKQCVAVYIVSTWISVWKILHDVQVNL
jgi:hypothetical protein